MLDRINPIADGIPPGVNRTGAFGEPFRQEPRGGRLTPTLTLLSLILLGIGIIWAAPHPPMLDLPGHAAQVALLRDLLTGRSNWSSELQVNLATPYLLGYGLALPLSLFLPIAAALKVVLTVSYLGFVGACIGLGRTLNAPRALACLYVPSFFGFAYESGLYTFLASLPVGIAFVWLAVHYAREPSTRRAALLASLGCALLLCHQLVFLWAGGVGGLILLLSYQSMRRFIGVAWPYIVMLIALVGFTIAQHAFAPPTAPDDTVPFGFGSAAHRLQLLAEGSFSFDPDPSAGILFAPLVLAPWLMGMKLRPLSKEKLAIFGGTALILLLAPSNAASTAIVYERFVVLLLPTYAWLFTPGNSGRPVAKAAAISLNICVAAILSAQLIDAYQFGLEERDYREVSGAVEPGQRALNMVLWSVSDSTGRPTVYVHHSEWYAAEHGGLVDFNFASYWPQVVRYRRVTPVDISVYFDGHPWEFDWKRQGADRFRYFFVRSHGEVPKDLFSSAPCPPREIRRSGHWHVFEACPTNRPAPAG